MMGWCKYRISVILFIFIPVHEMMSLVFPCQARIPRQSPRSTDSLED